MNTIAPKTGWRRFFTLKTSGRLMNEAQAATQKAKRLAAPTGLRGFISKEQQRIDELAARTDKFCGQIEQHFGQYAVYLEQERGGVSKFENESKTSGRKFAIKWRKQGEGYAATTVAFVLTEARDHGIRIDYVLSMTDDQTEVINDNWTGEPYSTTVSGTGVYKYQYDSTDDFRSVRRFDDMESFLEYGLLPQWFKDALDTYVGTPA